MVKVWEKEGGGRVCCVKVGCAILNFSSKHFVAEIAEIRRKVENFMQNKVMEENKKTEVVSRRKPDVLDVTLAWRG